jgi:hypothetical protein
VLFNPLGPAGETSDLADHAIMHLAPQLRRSPRAPVGKGLLCSGAGVMDGPDQVTRDPDRLQGSLERSRHEAGQAFRNMLLVCNVNARAIPTDDRRSMGRPFGGLFYCFAASDVTLWKFRSSLVLLSTFLAARSSSDDSIVTLSLF